MLDFGDLMILGMAFPNILGVLMLSGKIKSDLDSYLARLRAGEFPRRASAFESATADASATPGP